MTSKQQVLQQLLLLSTTTEELKSSLSQHGWDSEGEAELKKDHIISIIQRFLSNDLSLQDVLFWSNAIECREDIECYHSDSERLLSIIHEIANPDLYGVLDEKLAHRIICEMNSISYKEK